MIVCGNLPDEPPVKRPKRPRKRSRSRAPARLHEPWTASDDTEPVTLQVSAAAAVMGVADVTVRLRAG